MNEEFTLPELDVPEFDANEIDFNFDAGTFECIDDNDIIDTRYTKPRIYREISEKQIMYENAVKLAKELRLNENERVNVIVAGNFIFGDFIEAYVVEHNIHVKKMTISTLSLSANNVDSLANLINGGFVDELNLLLSHYFYANYKHNAIPYIYQVLDIDNKFQLAISGTHCKTCIFETEGGKKIVIHGSANLRSSGNVEQFTIEENKEMYDMHYTYQREVLERYATIQKPIRGKTLWKTMTKNF